jgi:hypothetical protein
VGAIPTVCLSGQGVETRAIGRQKALDGTGHLRVGSLPAFVAVVLTEAIAATPDPSKRFGRSRTDGVYAREGATLRCIEEYSR